MYMYICNHLRMSHGKKRESSTSQQFRQFAVDFLIVSLNGLHFNFSVKRDYLSQIASEWMISSFFCYFQ